MALREQWGLESLGDHSLPVLGYLEFLSFSSCPCKLKITKTTFLEDSAGAVVTSLPGCCMPLNPGDTWWYWQNLRTNRRPQNKVGISFRIILFKEIGDILIFCWSKHVYYMYTMQNDHEYLWETTRLQRNLMLGSGSNRLIPELPKDSYLLFSAAKLGTLKKSVVVVNDFKHHLSVWDDHSFKFSNYLLFTTFSLEMTLVTGYCS